MPAGGVKVDRTTRFGNPFITGVDGNRTECVRLFRLMLGGLLCASKGPPILAQMEAHSAIAAGLPGLRGKALACWCPQGAPCHADVLIELANLPTGGGS